MRYDNPYMTKEADNNDDIRSKFKNKSLSDAARRKLLNSYDPTVGIKRRNANVTIKPRGVIKGSDSMWNHVLDKDVVLSTAADFSHNVADQIDFANRRLIGGKNSPWRKLGVVRADGSSLPSRLIRWIGDKSKIGAELAGVTDPDERKRILEGKQRGNYIQSDYTGNNAYDKLTGKFVGKAGNFAVDAANLVDGIKGAIYTVTGNSNGLRDLQGKRLDGEYHKRKWDTHAGHFENPVVDLLADVATDPLNIALMGPGVAKGVASIAGKAGAKMAATAAAKQAAKTTALAAVNQGAKNTALTAAKAVAGQSVKPTFWNRAGKIAKYTGAAIAPGIPYALSGAGDLIIDPVDPETGVSTMQALMSELDPMIAVSQLDPKGMSPAAQQLITQAKEKVAALHDKGYYTGNALAAPVNKLPPSSSSVPQDSATKEQQPVSMDSIGTPDKPWYDKYDTDWKNWFGNVKFDDPSSWIPRLLSALLATAIVGGITGNGWAAAGAAPLGWGLGGAVQSNWNNINNDINAFTAKR